MPDKNFKEIRDKNDVFFGILLLRHQMINFYRFFFENEHGYFECISSGVKFQFFGAHFTSKSRIATRFSAFDRYTLPTCEKNLQYAYRSSKNFFP